MDRRRALALSGTAHAGVIVWALVAGFFDASPDEEPLQIASVGIVSEAEFAALVSRTPGPAAPAPEALTAPEMPDTAEAPTPTEEEAPPAPAPPPPTPAPPPPETTPDVAAIVAPPTTEAVTDTPEAPPPPAAADDAPVSDTPAPRQADRIAPIPTPAPPPMVEQAPVIEAPSEPSDAPEPEVVEEAQPEAAPEETTTAEVTEADEPAAAAQDLLATSRAPEVSRPPGRRPDRPAPVQAAAETEAPATPDPAPAPETPAPAAEPAEQPRAVDTSAALAEALAGGGSAAVEGEQLSDGQREGFRLAVQACWDLGAVSTDVLRTVVEVRFDMREDGFPVSSSIRLESSRGGTEQSVQIALERAQQAILGCARQNGGYDLPSESYGDWRDIVITFDPTR